MKSVNRIIHAYCAAWNERDKTKRDALLQQCWGERAVYTAPDSVETGVEGVSKAMKEFHDAQPGAYLKVVSGVDEHHGNVRFQWFLCDADGSEVLPGMSAGLVEEGCIQRMTGFFGPFPEPSSV